MIVKASHCFYSAKWSEPQYDGDDAESYLNLVIEKMPFVEAKNLSEALEKAFNYILLHPSEFTFQGIYLYTTKERPQIQLDYFRKYLHKTPPPTPLAGYHWITVEPVEVIS